MIFLPPILASPALAQVTVQAAEYFIDNDPGEGLGIPIPPSAAPDAALDDISETLTFTVDTSALLPGAHTIYIRMQDSNSNWGFARPLAYGDPDVGLPPNLAVTEPVKGVERITIRPLQGNRAYSMGHFLIE